MNVEDENKLDELGRGNVCHTPTFFVSEFKFVYAAPPFELLVSELCTFSR